MSATTGIRNVAENRTFRFIAITVALGVGLDVGATLCKIAVRVNEPKASASFKVLNCKRLDEGGFANPCLANDVHVMQAVSLLDPEQPVGIPKIGKGEI
jgi:hypothetical protein